MGRLTDRLYAAWVAQNGQARPSAGKGARTARTVLAVHARATRPPGVQNGPEAPAGGGVPSSPSRPIPQPVREAPRGPEKRHSFISE